jgi:hypothetical protein
MDDLNTLRKPHGLTMQFGALFLFAHMLFGIAMGSGFIEPHFGVISWVVMTILLVTIGTKEF